MPGYRFIIDMDLSGERQSDKVWDALHAFAENYTHNFDISGEMSPSDACFPHEVSA